ncbi:TnpV protein [Thomasclavelia cocleata]|uniref:TnpV protein n=1 Tax=Thomasclavelia cocleata TaxID=69824 RepID=UPI00272E4806|nr:TnpV protein [Thomasclavelia cocleata]
MELNYTKIGDYLLPNLTIEKQNNERINKYGYLRLHYLKVNDTALYTTLLMKNKLTNHLVSVSIEAENRLNYLMEQYKDSDKLLSEKSKMDNQLNWVKIMNNYKNMAEEVILKELIYNKMCEDKLSFMS